MSRREKYTVKVDFIADALIAIFIVTILFGGLGSFLGSNQASFNLSLLLVVMQVSAIALMVFSHTYTLGASISSREFDKELKYISLSLAGFFILDWVIPPVIPQIPVFGIVTALTPGSKFVTDLIAIPEESLFRGWAAPWFARRQLGIIGGALFSGAAFAIYHLFVYGDSPSLMVLVFGVGVIQGYIVLKSGRLSTVMVSHFIINVLATGLR